MCARCGNFVASDDAAAFANRQEPATKRRRFLPKGLVLIKISEPCLHQ
jgi:hypothetical protein